MSAKEQINVMVAVVTVSSFVERQKSITEQLHGLSLGHATFIYAWDIDTLHCCPFSFCDSLNVAAKSCAAKHLEAMKLFSESECTHLIVLEDDALFLGKKPEALWALVDKFVLLPEAKMLYLGGADAAAEGLPHPMFPDLFVLSPGTTTEAYIVDRTAANHRLSWARKNMLDLPVDHFYQKFDDQFGIIQLRPRRAVFTQGSVTGFFPTTLDLSRSRHSRVFLQIRFRLRRCLVLAKEWLR